MLKVFGNFSSVHLISGKVLYFIWQTFYNKSEFFSVVIFKYNLAIWSHWLGLPAKSRQTMGQYDKVTEI